MLDWVGLGGEGSVGFGYMEYDLKTRCWKDRRSVREETHVTPGASPAVGDGRRARLARVALSPAVDHPAQRRLLHRHAVQQSGHGRAAHFDCRVGERRLKLLVNWGGCLVYLNKTTDLYAFSQTLAEWSVSKPSSPRASSYHRCFLPPVTYPGRGECDFFG